MLKPMISIVLIGLAGPALAQETGEGPPPVGVSIELNAVVPSEAGGCTMSFLIENGREAEIGQAVFETVLFDVEGQVERLTLFDFGTLPPGRPRVRQFTLQGARCDGVGRILFNGVTTCEAAEAGACMDGLTLSSRTEIEVIG